MVECAFYYVLFYGLYLILSIPYFIDMAISAAVAYHCKRTQIKKTIVSDELSKTKQVTLKCSSS